MQLLIEMTLDDPLTLPLNYNHILQAIMYSNLGNAEYTGYIHDSGFAYEKRKYKLFTFGQIRGASATIQDRNITFFDHLSFEVRSPDPFLIRNIESSISKNGIRFKDRLIKDVYTVCGDDSVEGRALLVEMDSPITVYSTDSKTKKTYYYSPDDELFNYRICDNFYRKYHACYGVEPKSEIRIIPYNVQGKDKVVTTYKGLYITAYKGQYVLEGERKYLDFLYQAGLGSKNSQGFGLFDIIKEE